MLYIKILTEREKDFIIRVSPYLSFLKIYVDTYLIKITENICMYVQNDLDKQGLSQSRMGKVNDKINIKLQLS